MAAILNGPSGQPLQFTVKPQVNGDAVLTRPEIVGTVSQSGGVPTGAIIQRGSNANGEFVRYADGTQICMWNSADDLLSCSQTSTNSEGRYSPDITPTFPMAFSEIPFCSCFIKGTTGFMVTAAINDAPTTTTAQRFRGLTPLETATVVSFGVGYMAIGRWY